ncbi:MAG: hypothetical protein D6698_02485 [Gammaproteobacteria bacterium]|nr:MAG: hypothetical protein D6698_02485 [Gammaproteobacteria bacterium]
MTLQERIQKRLESAREAIERYCGNQTIENYFEGKSIHHVSKDKLIDVVEKLIAHGVIGLHYVFGGGSDEAYIKIDYVFYDKEVTENKLQNLSFDVLEEYIINVVFDGYYSGAGEGLPYGHYVQIKLETMECRLIYEYWYEMAERHITQPFFNAYR